LSAATPKISPSFYHAGLYLPEQLESQTMNLILTFLLAAAIPLCLALEERTFTSSSTDVSGLYAFNSTDLSLGIVGLSTLAFLLWAAVLNLSPSAAAKQDTFAKVFNPSSGLEVDYFTSASDRLDGSSCDCHNFCVNNLEHYASFARPVR